MHISFVQVEIIHPPLYYGEPVICRYEASEHDLWEKPVTRPFGEPYSGDCLIRRQLNVEVTVGSFSWCPGVVHGRVHAYTLDVFISYVKGH